MIVAIAVTAILIFAQGICKGVCDTLQFHYSISIFSKKNELFWNPAISWRNKYKNGEPEQGERFPGSTTVFVMFTDGWHLFDFLRILCGMSALLAAIAIGWQFTLLQAVIFLAAALIVHAAGFYLMYRYVLKKK